MRASEINRIQAISIYCVHYFLCLTQKILIQTLAPPRKNIQRTKHAPKPTTLRMNKNNQNNRNTSLTTNKIEQ